MNGKKAVATTIILVVAIITIFLLINNNGQIVNNSLEQKPGTNIAVNPQNTNTQKDNQTTNNTINNTVNNQQTTGITPEELAKHDRESDCWVGYDGKVYDITNFLPQHPGTAGRIIPFCGTEKEFTKNFIAQHGTSQVRRLMRVGVVMGDFQIKGATA